MKISKTYLILSLLLAGLAFALITLPKPNRNKDIQPELLLKEINDQARFLTPDFIAERLINEDPSLKLIDVRTPELFSKYTLPGALNIPLGEVYFKDWEPELNQDGQDVILFSNDDLHADQAWILCRRMGYNNIFVMKGGLNQWFRDIISPAEPPETAPKEDFEVYSFRKAAALYFSGAPPDVVKSDALKEKNILIKRVKKATTAGGC